MRIPLRILLVAALLASSGPAGAEFHFMSIREVYASGNSQYVLLQMYEDGQNLVSGHSLTVHDASGATIATYTFPSNVPNGGDQSYIWIATAAAENEFDLTADLNMAPTIARAAGMVCFDTVDCFSWGSYAGSSDPSPSGTPFAAGSGLSAGTPARRNVSGGTRSDALDAGDDTNDSAADFAGAAAPSPVNNAGSMPGGDPGYGGNEGGGGYGGGGGAMPGPALLALLMGALLARRRL